MRKYGQFCPVAKAAELFCERWTPLIIRDLAAGATRFSELQRGVPLMSPTLLSRRLRSLEAEGIVERRKSPGNRTATYHLTPAGMEFAPLVEALGIWGRRWSRRDLEEGEIDLGLLLWSIERFARADAFGQSRSVVELSLFDQPRNKQLWWFLNEGRSCTLCTEDPGFEVTLYLSCTLPDIIHVVRGDMTLHRAISEDRLEAIGCRAAQDALETWLNLGPLARVEPALPA
ncbi:winged helix-turn-helix transcriptional regulator [Amaricoccus macauensis]|uniref:winged helix-turn-helix transcriptional regulator n=1 Tax=Amaricoccus macauensis TaxID=57001 RepID=UPI003C79FAE0